MRKQITQGHVQHPFLQPAAQWRLERDRHRSRRGSKQRNAFPCVERLTALLQERADLPTTEILRIATTECGWSGSRATFFRLVRNLRPVQVPEPMVRCEGLPGEFAQFDFGEAVVIYADERTEKVIIFVGRLKLSRQVQVYVVPDQKTETLVRRVVAWWRAAGSGAGRPWSGCSIIPRPWS
jgi:hypothetical protein